MVQAMSKINVLAAIRLPCNDRGKRPYRELASLHSG